MGWETALVTTIHYNKQTYTSKQQVEQGLKESQNLIKSIQGRLKEFAIMTEPQKFAGKDEDPLFFVSSNMEELLESLSEEIVNEYKLNLLLEHWDECHTKDGIAIPIVKCQYDEYGNETSCETEVTPADLKELSYGLKSYLDGDFIPTIYDDKTKL